MSKRPLSFVRPNKVPDVNFPDQGKNIHVFFGGRLPARKDAPPEKDGTPGKYILIPLKTTDLEFNAPAKNRKESEAALFHEMQRLNIPAILPGSNGMYGGDLEKREKCKYRLNAFGESIIVKSYNIPSTLEKGDICLAKGVTFGAYRDPQSEYDSAMISVDVPAFVEITPTVSISKFMSTETFTSCSLLKTDLHLKVGYDPKGKSRKVFIAELVPMRNVDTNLYEYQPPGTLLARFADFKPKGTNMYYINKAKVKFMALMGYDNDKVGDLDVYVRQRDMNGEDLTVLVRTRIFIESLKRFQLPIDPGGKFIWIDLGPGLTPFISGTVIFTVDPKETEKMLLKDEFEYADGVLYTNTFVELNVAKTVKGAGFKFSPAHARQFMDHPVIRKRSFLPSATLAIGGANAVNLLTCPMDKAQQFLDNPHVEFYVVTNHGMQEVDLFSFNELDEDQRLKCLLGDVIGRASARYTDELDIVGALYAVVKDGTNLDITQVLEEEAVQKVQEFVPESVAPVAEPVVQEDTAAPVVPVKPKKAKLIEKA